MYALIVWLISCSSRQNYDDIEQNAETNAKWIMYDKM